MTSSRITSVADDVIKHFLTASGADIIGDSLPASGIPRYGTILNDVTWNPAVTGDIIKDSLTASGGSPTQRITR